MAECLKRRPSVHILLKILSSISHIIAVIIIIIIIIITWL